MTIEELQKIYEHCEWTEKPNKLLFPVTWFSMEQKNEWNNIYALCKQKFLCVEPTASGGMPYNHMCRMHSRYMVVETNVGIELCVVSIYGCYRFIIRMGKLKKDNTVSGRKALQTVIKTAKQFGVSDIIEKAKVDEETGLKIKEEIKSPMIEIYDSENTKPGEYDNVHHLDLNSSYASRIAEAIPELRPMYTWLYEHRKDNDGYFKHVLTNSIGCMQSKYCIDPITNYTTTPYALAEFAKIAINGTNAKIEKLLTKLQLEDRKPLLINTDGIWYQGEIYHDREEGTQLGQWKCDHKNCKLYIKSEGAYQYIEDNKVHTVLRGYTQLDKQGLPREKWGWRQIDDLNVTVYKFDETKGIISYEE